MPDRTKLAVPPADSLIDKAVAATGLDDFGKPGFREGLERYLDSLVQDQENFTQAGIDELAVSFVDSLSQRLRVERHYAEHPETERQRPVAPLMITGLPRTGTSAFGNILSIDPAFRPLRTWEQVSPVPPPVLAQEATDPRRLRVQQGLEAMKRDQPEQMVMHLHELDSTSEDVQILRHEFRAQSFTAPAFSYHRWWRTSDMSAAYAYQRRVIKLLQSRRPPDRWLFKAPHYAFHLEDVCAAYPDARFVVTHRDPIKTLPSWASLFTSLYPTGSRERVSMAELGPHTTEHQAIGMRRMMDARARIGEDRFLDVHHHHFVDDPIGTLARVYDFIDLPFPTATQARMRDWSERNKPGTHGQHRYTAQQYGIDEQAVRERFAFYTDHYGVRLETIGH